MNNKKSLFENDDCDAKPILNNKLIENTLQVSKNRLDKIFLVFQQNKFQKIILLFLEPVV